MAFEYADKWLANGFSISPFSLPLEKRVLLRGGVRSMAFSAFSMTAYPMDGESSWSTGRWPNMA